MDRDECERQRILAILEQSDSEKSGISSESEEDQDRVSVQSQETDTEQAPSSSDEDDTPLSELQVQRSQYYVGKDGTKWQKQPFRQNRRTRMENIITVPPGVQPQAKSALSEIDC
ncbi:unnamed protein product [Colias eurytheme]|nr:unnamed protein product [Colias eurytheme]